MSASRMATRTQFVRVVPISHLDTSEDMVMSRLETVLTQVGLLYDTIRRRHRVEEVILL